MDANDEALKDARARGRAEGEWAAMRHACQYGTLRCYVCGHPATCIGAYETPTPVLPACDDCCGHGREDGDCEKIEEAAAEAEGDDGTGDW